MTQPTSLAVVFADLSGSTRLYDKLGDQRALAIIERCLEMFRGAAVARRGVVIKSIGDEILATFADAASACSAVVDMQLALINIPDVMENAVSMHCGVHWGEVTLTGGDVFGDTVNVAARLTTAAKRGQIVISGEVCRMLPPSFPFQMRFMGAEPVKGKEAAIEMHELLWEPNAELTEMVQMSSSGTGAETLLAAIYLGSRYELNRTMPILTLGRDPASGIVVNDKLSSRNHARLEKGADKYVYTDFSSNGTFVQLSTQDEVLVRRDSIVLRTSGTISFGRPYAADPAAAIRFEIVPVLRR